MTRPPNVAAILVLVQGTAVPPFTSWAQFIVFLVALGMTLKWIWGFVRDLKGRRNGNGTVKTIADLRVTLEALNGTLAVLAERIDNLPTKVDLLKAAEDNRHAIRNMLAGVQGDIVDAVEVQKGAILQAITQAKGRKR